MLIGKKDQEAIKSHFAALTGKVRMVFFEAALDCPYCPQTKQLVTELAELSPLLEVEVYNYHTDEIAVKKYGINKIPAIVLLDGEEKDYGIRFYGIPSGYEFSTLIEDIMMVSTGKTSLTAKTIETLKNLKQKVHLQVFVTPT
nr:thioredoxin family protein [Sulfoacidibacillus thermotolerans]